ncbi:MAG: hypothetical protein K8R35_09540 [Bacteroidales bacterium]|nr:hypothetical protein [Bacteroidales bacterium]
MKNSVTGVKTNPREIINPFPGLRPFSPDESDLFFGREGQSDEVMAKLTKSNFVTVIGASGSGKSSLIYCGVIPRLIKKDQDGTKREWLVHSMRPGNNPIGNLTDLFAGAIEGIRDENKKKIESLFQDNKNGIEDAVALLNLKKGTKLLLIVDQFEELFRFKTSRKDISIADESKRFVNLLVNAITKSDQIINVIITMRSDFIGECSHFQGLTNLINESNYLVPHMARENYMRAITGPVEYAGADIEPELTDLLLNEIGSRIDQLPVLQHALMRTWSHWSEMGQTNRPVSVADYDAVGQMSEAMSRHANEAYEELDSKEKEICQVLFKTITEKGSDNKGLRHPTKVETIAAIARCSVEELCKVVDIYRAVGRSFITPGTDVKLTPETVIDISHESLMRVWDRLAEWVDEEAASVLMYVRLSEASEMFQEGKTTLWRPPDLQLALNWRNDNMPTLTWAVRFNPAFERAMVYLRTSEKEYQADEENKIRAQKRQLRRSRITAMILGTAAIISVFFMLFAFVKQVEAEKSKQEAIVSELRALDQEQLALDNADEARVNAERAQEQEQLALANAEEAQVNARRANVQRSIADKNAEDARTNAELAQEQEKLANENAERAVQQEELAIENAKEATRLRMVSISKSMAIKSIQVIGQGDLQSLLAYQAYIFNKRNKGLSNDADIYMGLYNVAKLFGGQNYKNFEGHSGSVRSVSFLKSNNQFFTSGSDGKVMRWSLDISNSDPQIIFQGNEIMDIITISNDGKYLACGNDQSVIRVFPVSGSGIAFDLNGHNDKIKSLVFTPDNRFMYSAGLDGQLLKWDMETKNFSVIDIEDKIVVSLDISESGEYLAGATTDGEIKLWNLLNDESLDPINSENGSVNVIRFRNSDVLAVGFMSGVIELWNIETYSKESEVKGHTARVSDIRFNDIINQMASSSMDGIVKIWNTDDFTEPPISLADNEGFVLALAFSPDGQVLISGGVAEGRNLIARPSHVDYMVSDICSILTRNFTQEEWDRYVAKDIDYEETCAKKDLSIRVQEKNGD